MKKIFFIFYFIFFYFLCSWQMVFATTPAVSLEKAPIDRSDKASIERGAKFFAVNCMSCHTMIYLRYNKLAREAGITYEKMPVNVKWPPDANPPDLSVDADVRGVDWIYTYLHSFYMDPSRKTGVNNLLIENTMMPGIVTPYQGQQVLANDVRASQTLTHNWQWYDLLVLQSKGAMTSQEFDQTIADVVNFLAYAAEPFHEEQIKLGKWVLIYLLILFVFVYLLKQAYWKDLH